MKRSIAFTIILFVLSLAFILTSHFLVYGSREDIGVEEEVFQGDRKYAHNLDIRQFSNVGRFRWKGLINKGLDSEFKYSFEDKEADLGIENPFGDGIELYINHDAGFDAIYITDRPDKHRDEYKEIFKELSDENINESYRKRVKLKDFYDYYPIVSSPAFSSRLASKDIKVEFCEENYDFMDYFKIPVMDDEYLYLNNRDGRANFDSHSYNDEDWNKTYYPMSQSVVIGKYAYFSFSTHRRDGKVVDTSQIKDGYGVYKIEGTLDGDNPKISGEIKIICPLDPKGELIKLSKTEDGSKLVVFMKEDGETYLYLIDLSKEELTQKLPVGRTIKLKEGDYFSDSGIIQDKDLFLARQEENASVLLGMNNDGEYELKGVFPVNPSYNIEKGMDYKDGKLAFVQYNKRPLAVDGDKEDIVPSGTWLIVAEDGKVLYEALIRSDIDKFKDFNYRLYYGKFCDYEVEWGD
ncbi:MAG: hypothetical protein GX219_10115 [Tissierellia bacterium]|nr:hypothetical protein [Tissierellia bacterium]